METKKRIFVVISGLSGTGKNFFQDIILESAEQFQRIPKYTTRSQRIGEENSIDLFGVDSNNVESCTWSYSINNNSYGIKAEDVKKIIEARK